MFPLILRSTHQQVVSRLECEVSELKGRVDRSVHEQTVRLLKERIGELEQSLAAAHSDLRTVQDTQTAYIFGQVLRDGKRTMFDPRMEREHAENEIPLAKTEEQERLSDVARARQATGSNDVRVITRYIERQNRKKHVQKLRQQQGVPADFEAAIEEGRKAVQSVNAPTEAIA